jgi:hypothetical protein
VRALLPGKSEDRTLEAATQGGSGLPSRRRALGVSACWRPFLLSDWNNPLAALAHLKSSEPPAPPTAATESLVVPSYDPAP